MKRVNTTKLMRMKLKKLIHYPVLFLLSPVKLLMASKPRTSLTISLMLLKKMALTRKMRWIGMTTMMLTTAGSHQLCAMKALTVILPVIMLSLVLASLASSKIACELNLASTTLRIMLSRFMEPPRRISTMRLRRL